MDEELERLKEKRLEELRRRLLLEKLRGSQEAQEKEESSNEELLDRFFVNRAWEVFNAARHQYPQASQQVEAVLVNAIKQGRITSKIDGASLMGLFRRIGLPVRLETKIRISEKGELKSLEQKIREDLS